MKFLDFLRADANKNSAKIARERLQIIVAHERANRNKPDYLPAMRQDIIDVIRKYVHIDPKDVSVQMASEQNVSVLELNITLSDENYTS